MMDELVNSIRSAYSSIWVFNEEIIYLVMDNTGGHGKNEAVLEYSKYLAANYNIVVHHQVPQLPETTITVLGARIIV